MRRLLNHVCWAMLISVLACSGALAQGGTAQISGSVSDPSGAVLPGVDITATQTETGISRTTVSNETGFFVLPNLPVGPYKLEAALPGFRTFVRTGIVLQVNSSPLVNLTLEVGQVSETVEVQANAAMVETRATGIGQVIDNAQILELPLIGRQVQDLVVLSGAAVQTSVGGATGRTFPGVARFSIAGGVDGGTSYTLDGASHNDVRQNTGLPLPFPDALQEFKVETSAVPAQYGFRSGGAINAVTKSGTNQFHGDGFWFVRNNVFNARDFFSDKRDTLKRNQFGGTIGGPIKQNKLFFFAAFQGTTTRQAPTDSISFVPTPAMIAGDFTKFASAACGRASLTVSAANPFVNNVLPQSAISPAAVALAKQLPPAEDDCGTVHWGTPFELDEQQYIGKLDYQFKNNHAMFWRYMGYPYKQALAYDKVASLLVTNPPGIDNLFQSLIFGDTITIGANKVNSFRLGWNRQAVQRTAAFFFGANDIGVKNFYQPFKRLNVSVSNAFSMGGTTGMSNYYNTTGGQIADDFGILTGAHQLNFGGNWMTYQTNNVGASFAVGQFTFNGGTTGQPLADFMAGKVANISQGNPNFMYVRTKVFGTYGQDSWRVRPNLTLSLGVRWEPYLPMKLIDTISYFDQAAFLRGDKSSVFANAPAGIFYPGDSQFPADGNPTNAIKKNWDQFAPRLGMVWDPLKDGKTVVRAAWGLFYETQTSEVFISAGQGPPWGGRLIVNDVPFDNPYQNYPGGNPFPYPLDKNSPFPQGGAIAVAVPDTVPPYVHQWNVGIQRELAPNWLAAVSYIGNKMNHLYGASELNPGVFIPGVADSAGLCTTTVQGKTVSLKTTAGATCSTAGNVQARRVLTLLDTDASRGATKYGNVNTWDDGGQRNYHGMLLSLTKRLSSNFSATANYTWSHCIGHPTNILLNPGASGVVTDTNNRNYDRSDCTSSGTDIRHIANATMALHMPRFANAWVQRVAGNWRLTGILRAKSGDPLPLTFSTDRTLTGINIGQQRPDLLSTDVYGNQCTTDLRATTPTCRWLNANAFGMPTLGVLGTIGGTTVRGPGEWIVDTGLSRTFELGETQRLEFRGEASNVLNHTNFGNPTTALGGTFGRISSAGEPRIIQFGMKYTF